MWLSEKRNCRKLGDMGLIPQGATWGSDMRPRIRNKKRGEGRELNIQFLTMKNSLNYSCVYDAIV